MAAEEVVSRKIIFRGRAVNLRIDTVRTAAGRETTREVVEHADCIGIIPVDAEGNLLLVRQFREAVAKEMLEIPAGGIDPGESPEDAVRREMQEETGYLPGVVERLGGCYSTPGYCTEYLYLFLARDLTPSRRTAEDTEGITVVRVAPAKIPQLIASGEIEDAKSIASLLIFLGRQT